MNALVLDPVSACAVVNGVTGFVGGGGIDLPKCETCGGKAHQDWFGLGRVHCPDRCTDGRVVPQSGAYVLASTNQAPQSGPMVIAPAWDWPQRFLVVDGVEFPIPVGRVLGTVHIDILPVVERYKLGVDSAYDPGGGPWIGRDIGGMFEDRLEFIARHNGLMGYTDISACLPFGDWSGGLCVRFTNFTDSIECPTCDEYGNVQSWTVDAGWCHEQRTLSRCLHCEGTTRLACPVSFSAPDRPCFTTINAEELQ